MRKQTKAIVVLLIFIMIMGIVSGCAKMNEYNEDNIEEQLQDTNTTEADSFSSENQDITIVYTNDVHSYIDNVKKDSDGNVIGDGLRFSKIAAMVKDMRADGQNVLLVDAGDEIQGDIYGAMDEGENIIKIMKAAGYQLATPGNHDFDYGVIQCLKLIEEAGFPYVTCNFHSTKTKEIIFEPSHIFEIAGKKVAFVGVTTPETITSSTPTYFQDEKGEFIYTVDGIANPEDMYVSVQSAIDNIKDEADYVIGIGHVGVAQDSTNKKIDSISLINNVTGLDAFIDGHSHTTMEKKYVKDKEGKDVLLTQTGYYLNAVGVMTIKEDGSIDTKLVNDYDKEDETVALLEKEWKDEIEEQMNEKIAVLENELYIGNPDDKIKRLIRSREMNLGDFTADSVYWFFNEKLLLNCDVAIQNGGGIRAGIEKGTLNYMNVKQVAPFGNMICLIAATGQQIVDSLEMGSKDAGGWNEEWDIPAENGGFMQVAGLKYTIDTTIPSSVQVDENGMFKSVDGEYKVKDVEIYNKDTGEYEPIDLEKEYQVGGLNYILRNDGSGMSMYSKDELTVDYVGEDYVILAEYMKAFEKKDGYPLINTKNSPLAKYSGYLLDYENPYGAGRITECNGDDSFVSRSAPVN